MASIKRLSTAKVANPVLQAISPLDLLRAYVELKTVEIQEQTKIQAILAQRDVAVRELRLRRRLLLAICDRVFVERHEALEKFFDLLDKSVAEKDEKGLDVALRGIAGIVTTSPFIGLAEFLKVMKGESPQIEL